MKMNSSRFLAMAVFFLAAMPNVESKQLVILAGPRQKEIQQFFYQHATGSEESDGLGKWRWPTVSDEDFELLLSESEDEISKHGIFRLLFDEEQNSLVQQVLLQAIRESYENSENGIILGEERLSNVGVDQFTPSDASKIIFRLMENLSITPHDITLVLVYDTPRIQEWASIWHQESIDQTYSDFLCNDDGDDNDDDERLQHLDTTMNPFRISKIYREYGWNVAVIDEQGVRNMDVAPAHAIACNVLDVSCDDGWVAGMKGKNSGAPQSYEINELRSHEKEDLEQLFRSRDCLYKQELEVDIGTTQFQIVNQEQIWKDCANHYAFEYKEALGDVDFFFDAIRSQRGCGREYIDLSDVFATASSSNFSTELWLLAIGLIFCLTGASGIVFFRLKKAKEFKRKGDGLFKNDSFSNESTATTTPVLNDSPRALCNACKSVRFDSLCPFCVQGKRKPTSGMAKEIERRVAELQSSDITEASDEMKNDHELDHRLSELTATSTNTMASGYMDGSLFVGKCHLDIAPRNRIRRGKKDKEKKSKVMKKLNELLVLKSGDRTTILCSEDNLQTRFSDESDKAYV